MNISGICSLLGAGDKNVCGLAAMAGSITMGEVASRALVR